MAIFIILIAFTFVIICAGANAKPKEDPKAEEERVQRQKDEYYAKIEREKKEEFDKYKDYEFISIPVRGIYYRKNDAKESIGWMNIKTSDITIEREKRNRYDKYAVAVYYGDKLGYVPAECSEQISKLIDEDKVIKVLVESHSGLLDDYYYVLIRIYYKK